jgi:hypothetical protein
MYLCHWMTTLFQISSIILFTDQASVEGGHKWFTKFTNVVPWKSKSNKSNQFPKRFSVHVWCGLLSKKEAGQQFNKWQVLILHKNDLPGQLNFQHDRAPTHYTQDVREYLHKNFSSCLLGRGGPISQPLRSPDLTLLDFCLWGHMTALMYERKVDSRTALCHCTLCNSSVYIQTSRQQCISYLISMDACWTMHTNWSRTLWTIAVKQVF